MSGLRRQLAAMTAERDAEREAKEKAESRVKELEAIVMRLPLAADGVPVVPGMTLVRRDGRDGRAMLAYWAGESGTYRNFDLSNWYSTRAAAEIAKKEKSNEG